MPHQHLICQPSRLGTANTLIKSATWVSGFDFYNDLEQRAFDRANCRMKCSAMSGRSGDPMPGA